VIRINLIPPEILQNRKDEQRWKWMALVGVVVVAVLVLFWAFMALEVTASTTEVDSIVQEVTGLEAQAAQFQVFQATEADLNVRKGAVLAAKSGSIQWAQMLYELGLVLPKDIYLTSFSGVDAGTEGGSNLSLVGVAMDRRSNPDNGYKSVAKMLVRLAELDQLGSVWLSNTTLAQPTGNIMPNISWNVSAKITTTATPSPSGD
jgi:Tfp pilus assembly protein PilN